MEEKYTYCQQLEYSFATGVNIIRITECQDRLYITTNGGGQNVLVYNTNGGLIRRISVPANHARGVIVGIDGNLHVSNFYSGITRA